MAAVNVPRSGGCAGGGAGGTEAPGDRRAAKIARVVKIAVFAGVVLMVLRFALTYRSVRVPEGNDQMAPTLEPGARVLVHRGFRRAKDFRRGYIVAYAAQAGEGEAVELRFGRVVAVPGDRVELEPRRGDASRAEVRVNGEIASYSPEIETGGEGGVSFSPRGGLEPIVVPDGALYLVNDRRSSGLADSRRAGPVDERSFVGKVVLTLSW